MGRYVARLPLKHSLAWSMLAITTTELVHRGRLSWKLDLADSILTTAITYTAAIVTK